MRNTRIATLALALVVALAGAAAALHATLNASHAASTGHMALAGGSAAEASDDGISVGAGLAGDHASLDGAARVALPGTPALPEVPATPAVPATPEVPALSGSADGAAGLATEHASLDAAGGVDLGP